MINEYLEFGTKQLSYKYKKDTPGEQTTMKREKFIPKNVMDEDVPAFMGALAQAAKDGKKDFKFGDKTYKVKLKKDVADKITKNMDESKDFEPHMMYDPKTGKEYKAEKPEDHERMKKLGYTHEKPEMKSEATESDYMKLSDKELDELLTIFENVHRSTSKDVMKALSLEKKRRSLKEDQNLTQNKKEKNKMYFNDKKTQKVAEAVKRIMKSKEESNAFTAAASAAKLAGKTEFEFEGKKYPVKIKDDAAKAIAKESVELQEAADFGDIEKVMKWAKKNLSDGKFPKFDISKKYGTAFINLTITNIITLRIGGKKGIVVTHDDRTNGKGIPKEEHFSNANEVIKFIEKVASKQESVEVEEETLQEGKFDKLEKKIGRINPESLQAVMSGKIKLNPAEKKEFDEFMTSVRKMFASKQY
jgi:hypothetical protein